MQIQLGEKTYDTRCNDLRKSDAVYCVYHLCESCTIATACTWGHVESIRMFASNDL